MAGGIINLGLSAIFVGDGLQLNVSTLSADPSNVNSLSGNLTQTGVQLVAAITGLSGVLTSSPVISGPLTVSNGVIGAGNLGGSGGTSYGSVMPIILYAKNVPVRVAGTPADIASIPIPSGISRYRPFGNSATTAPFFWAYVEAATGSVACSVVINNGANGGGSQLDGLQITLPSAQGVMAGDVGVGNLVSTSGTLYIRQSTNAPGTGMCSFYLNIWPLP